MPRYIDAEKLLSRMKQDPLFPIVERYGISGVIEAEPTADVVEVKHGKWYRPREWTTKTYRRLCTNCQNVAYYCGTGDYKFCPNCGARMESE